MNMINASVMALLLAGTSLNVLAAPLLIANQASLAVEKLAPYTQINSDTWQLVAGDINAMATGQVVGLFSEQKWTDADIAQYERTYGEKPIQLMLAAKDDQTDVDMARKAELFSGRAEKPILYLYLNKTLTGQAGIELGNRLSSLDAERWQLQGWIAPPASIRQVNEVSLGLASAAFEGGYR